MVLLEAPQPEMQHQPGEWEVYRVMSQSEPGVFHVVAVAYIDSMDMREPVDWLCSCKGFNYSKTCWHVEFLGYGV